LRVERAHGGTRAEVERPLDERRESFFWQRNQEEVPAAVVEQTLDGAFYGAHDGPEGGFSRREGPYSFFRGEGGGYAHFGARDLKRRSRGLQARRQALRRT
jgi:hypothetical protein